MPKVATVGGVAGLGFLAVGLGLPRVIEDLSPYVSYGVAAFGVVLLVGCYLWTLMSEGGGGESVLKQKTTGLHSPNIGHARDIHFNYGPPTPEPKPEPESPWNDPNFKLSNSSTWAASDEMIPNMELREVLDILYGALGGPPQLIGDFEKRVDLKIQDGVHHWGLHTWGRKKPSGTLVKVWSTAWERGDFSHKRGSVHYRDPDNPRALHAWGDLHFNRDEVTDWLRECGHDGRSKTTGY